MPQAPAGTLLRHVRKLLAGQDSHAAPDQVLLQRFVTGHEEAAFAALVQRYGPLVLGVCRRVLGHEQDAEDAFQATFLVLARRAGSIRKRDALSSWLYGVAYRIAAKARVRVARRRAEERRPPARPAADSGDAVTWGELRIALDEELRRLPEKYRAPLVLCYLDGKTQDEAARQLGWTPGSVKGRLERGRLLLRGRLTRRGITLSAALLGAVLGEQAASAAVVPALLAASTARAALAFAAGAEAAGAGVSAEVVALAEVGLKAAAGSHAKLGLVLLLGATAAVAGAGALAWQGPAAKAPEARQEAASPPSPPEAVKEQPPEQARRRTDRYGDPLPEGAVARLGTLRLRHAGLSDFVLLPGGQTVLSAGGDRVLRYWELATGRQVRAIRLQGTAGPGSCVTLSPDGKTLVAQDGGALVIWDVDSGKQLKRLPGPKGEVGFLFFSPDRSTLAVGRSDWRISFWDWEAGKEREVPLPFRPRPVVEFHRDSSFHGSFSPDGKWFVAGASSLEPLGVFEVATGREVHRLTCSALVSAVSPDSRRLAVVSFRNDKGGRETVVRLFDLASGKEVAQFPFGTEDPFFALAFSPDGKLLACGFSDHSCLLDLTTGRLLHRLPDRPQAPVFTPGGKTLVARVGQRLRLWDVATGKERHDWPGEFGYTPALAVSPDGRLLAAGDWMDQEVSLWDTAGEFLLRRLPLKGQGRYVIGLEFTADGQTLWAGQGMGFLQCWDLARGRERQTIQLRDPAGPNNGSVDLYQLYLFPDGKHMSTLERVGPPAPATRLALREATTGKLVAQQLFGPELRRGAWSADGSTAALSLNNGLALVDVPTGLVRFTIPGVVGGSPLAISANARLVAGQKRIGAGAEAGTGTVTVWETATGKEVTTVAGGRVGHLALAPDDRSLVTTDGGFLHVWDLATGKERRRWHLSDAGTDSWEPNFVRALLLSSNGRRAFSALADGTALVWDLSPALRRDEPLARQASEKELAVWWTDLAGGDAGRAYAASWRLAEAPEGPAIAFLRAHLRPVRDANEKEVRQLVADLDSDTFAARDKAFKRLEELGDSAVPALRAALKEAPSAEVRSRLERLLSRPQALIDSPEVLRGVRAIGVLERIGTPAARQVVESLASGVPEARVTQEAKATLGRLVKPAQR